MIMTAPGGRRGYNTHNMPERTNKIWLADLRNPGPAQEAALADLRGIIQTGLKYTLQTWLSPNDPRYPSLVEEVTQDTLLRVLDRLDSFEGRSKFTTWVHSIAVRLALTELRRSKWRDVSLESLLEKDSDNFREREVTEPQPNPEAQVERNLLIEQVKQMMLEELTEKQRNAMLAVVIHGMPIEEVARRMDTNRNALYKLMHDGRLKLKQRLAREGLSVEEVLGVFEVM
jgi:RNA polymerase sigma-70 factor (ECF subfamily)